jgi:hypothetical protein
MISAEHELVGVMPRGSRGRGGGVPMIVPFVDMVKLRDGESIRVVGEHRDVAERLARTP